MIAAGLPAAGLSLLRAATSVASAPTRDVPGTSPVG
jgi:hypothetical protein